MRHSSCAAAGREARAVRARDATPRRDLPQRRGGAGATVLWQALARLRRYAAKSTGSPRNAHAPHARWRRARRLLGRESHAPSRAAGVARLGARQPIIRRFLMCRSHSQWCVAVCVSIVAGAGCAAGPGGADPIGEAEQAATGVCAAEMAAVQTAQAEEREAGSELQGAKNVSERQQALIDIRIADADLRNADIALNNCMIAHGGKPPLDTQLDGVSTLTIASSDVSGPITSNISLGLEFAEWAHSTFQITSFPPITVGPVPTRFGGDTVTVTDPALGGGHFDPSTGAGDVTFTLHLHNSLILAGDSDVTFTLTTSNPGGHPLDASNGIALAGSSTFSGGALGGSGCTLVVNGTLAARP
jgi:hypothetical protein